MVTTSLAPQLRSVIMRLGIFVLMTALFALACLCDGTDQNYRPLPATLLSMIRGADPGSPTSSIKHCDDQNGAIGEVGYTSGCNSPSVNNQTVCVYCKDDLASNSSTAPGSSGPNFAPFDYYSCTGIKQFGKCTQSSSGYYTCVVKPWDMTSYCGGALYETLKQEVDGPDHPH